MMLKPVGWWRRGSWPSPGFCKQSLLHHLTVSPCLLVYLLLILLHFHASYGLETGKNRNNRCFTINGTQWKLQISPPYEANLKQLLRLGRSLKSCKQYWLPSQPLISIRLNMATSWSQNLRIGNPWVLRVVVMLTAIGHHFHTAWARRLKMGWFCLSVQVTLKHNYYNTGFIVL
jgi:hypothetical protein